MHIFASLCSNVHRPDRDLYNVLVSRCMVLGAGAVKIVGLGVFSFFSMAIYMPSLSLCVKAVIISASSFESCNCTFHLVYTESPISAQELLVLPFV